MDLESLVSTDHGACADAWGKLAARGVDNTAVDDDVVAIINATDAGTGIAA